MILRPLSAGALAAGVSVLALMLATPARAFAPSGAALLSLRTCSSATSARRVPLGGVRVSRGIGALGMSGGEGKKGGREGEDDLDWINDMPTYGGGEADGGAFQLPEPSDQSR